MASDSTGITPYYTISLSIVEKSCLVVGGGEVARRKAASLSDGGARVTVISPALDPVLDYMVSQNEVAWKQKEFEADDITDNLFIVVAATEKRAVNQQVADICRTRHILCNVVDEPDEGSYIVPATVERGAFTIAISTSGISPTLAASVRQELEMAYGEEYGQFLELMTEFRSAVQQEFRFPQARQKIFDRMVSSRALSMLRNGLKDQARRELQEILEEARKDPSLAGGGPLPIL